MYVEQKYLPFKPRDQKNWKYEKKAPTMTHAEFLKNDTFQAACSRAQVQPTTRQASKYRRGMGAAYKMRKSQGAE